MLPPTPTSLGPLHVEPCTSDTVATDDLAATASRASTISTYAHASRELRFWSEGDGASTSGAAGETDMSTLGTVLTIQSTRSDIGDDASMRAVKGVARGLCGAGVPSPGSTLTPHSISSYLSTPGPRHSSPSVPLSALDSMPPTDFPSTPAFSPLSPLSPAFSSPPLESPAALKARLQDQRSRLASYFFSRMNAFEEPDADRHKRARVCDGQPQPPNTPPLSREPSCATTMEAVSPLHTPLSDSPVDMCAVSRTASSSSEGSEGGLRGAGHSHDGSGEATVLSASPSSYGRRRFFSLSASSPSRGRGAARSGILAGIDIPGDDGRKCIHESGEKGKANGGQVLPKGFETSRACKCKGRKKCELCGGCVDGHCACEACWCDTCESLERRRMEKENSEQQLVQHERELAAEQEMLFEQARARMQTRTADDITTASTSGSEADGSSSAA